jgi:hypothetical protein
MVLEDRVALRENVGEIEQLKYRYARCCDGSVANFICRRALELRREEDESVVGVDCHGGPESPQHRLSRRRPQ